jgi:hypothetical protein
MLYISVSNRYTLYIYSFSLFLRNIFLHVSSASGFLDVAFVSLETEYLNVEKIQKNQEGNLDQHVSSKMQYYLK